MNQTQNQTLQPEPSTGGDFCAVTGAAALATLASPRAEAEVCRRMVKVRRTTRLQTGNGEWTYEVVPGWGQLPAGTAFGGTHGAIATDKAGHVYVSTQSETGILVYQPDGMLLKTIATEYPEVHSIFHAEEGRRRVSLHDGAEGDAEGELALRQDEDRRHSRAEDYRSAGGRIQSAQRVAAHGGRAGPGRQHLHRQWLRRLALFRFDKNGEYRASYGGQRHSGWPIRLQPRPGSRYALRSAASAGLRPREPPPLPLRFRRKIRANRHAASAPALPGKLSWRLCGRLRIGRTRHHPRQGQCAGGLPRRQPAEDPMGQLSSFSRARSRPQSSAPPTDATSIRMPISMFPTGIKLAG